MNPVRGSVGIIANPLSGSDIRRVVGLGSVYGVLEKINVVQRILAGLEILSVERIYFMPDVFGIAQRALDKLPRRLERVEARSCVIDIPLENSAADSTRAASEMRELGVGCIVVLGGDGTNRAVAEGSENVPILPVGTGTNNVVPYQTEGTAVGVVAGLVAGHPEIIPRVAYRSKKLQVEDNGEVLASALVDIAVVDGDAVGARAVYDGSTLRQVMLTRGEPGALGLSALGGISTPFAPTDPWGLCFWTGEPEVAKMTVPLAPGLFATLNIEKMSRLGIGESVAISGGGKLLALDGERDILLRPDQSVRVYLRSQGPWIVDMASALQEVTAQGMLVSWTQIAT